MTSDLVEIIIIQNYIKIFFNIIISHKKVFYFFNYIQISNRLYTFNFLLKL